MEVKFYFTDRNGGNRKKLTMNEVKQRLSAKQIEEAVTAKQKDTNEEVSYMTVGGFIVCEI